MSHEDTEDDPKFSIQKMFIEILKRKDNDNKITINEFSEVSLDESYTNSSDLTRVNIIYTNSAGEKKMCYLIVKDLPKSEFRKMVKDNTGLQRKEMNFYKICVPHLISIHNEACSGEDFIVPTYYHSPSPTAIVTQDLLQFGYRSIDRRKQLDQLHANSAIVCLAKFHALSTKLKINSPDVLYKVGEEINNEANRELFEPDLNLSLSVTMDSIKGWPEMSKFVTKIEELSEKAYDKLIYVYRREESAFNVLNHGHAAMSNMMFHYHLNAIHCMLLDFQLCRYTTPALDLLHFFATSCRIEVLTSHYQSLLVSYHAELSRIMSKLGVPPPPPVIELEKEILRRSYVLLVSLFYYLPKLLAAEATADTSSLTDLQRIGVQVVRNSSNPRYRDVVTKTIQFFDKLGFLDAAHETTIHIK